MMFHKGEVVQFTEDHKWRGCRGIIDEVKDLGGDKKYLIGVPVPERRTAYIFSMESDNEFEAVGFAVLVPQ